jgi:DNA-directed RNA polymerase specialized sigma24 family protein
MATPAQRHFWWDREADSAGRPIRQDVRTAANELWEEACRRTDLVLADRAQAADLMERSVAETSRYLDRISAPSSSRKHGLVMVAFCRALRRYARKSARLELVGGSNELSDHSVDNRWPARANARLELEKIGRQLTHHNAEVLMLRAAGFEWKQIAQIFGLSVPAARNGFWREIERIRWNLAGPQEKRRVPIPSTAAGYVPVPRNSER